MTKRHYYWPEDREMEKTAKKSQKKLIITLAIVGAMFYVLNLLTPMMLDDLDYSFNFTSFLRVSDWDRNQNLGDIFESLRHHYVYSNGRLVVHFFAFLFCMLGKNVFNIFNTIAFLLLGLVIYYHAKGDLKSINIKALIFIYTMLFWIVPDFGQSFLWMVGACNYLWGTLIVLTFLIPFRKEALKSRRLISGENETCTNKTKNAGSDSSKTAETKNKKQVANNVVKGIFCGALGLIAGTIAGACNENAGAMLIFTLPAFLYFYKKHGVKWQAWMFTGWAGTIAGIVSIIISPGQQTRLSNSGGSGIGLWIRNIFRYSFYMLKYCWFLILLIAILLVVYFVMQKKNNRDFAINSILVDIPEASESKIFIRIFGVPMVYAFAVIVSVYSMIVSPDFPKRAWVLSICLMIILIIQMYDRVKYQFTVEQVESRMATFIFVLIAANIFVFISAVQSLGAVNSLWKSRMEIFEQAKQEGAYSVDVDVIRGNSRYSCYPPTGDLKEDPDVWPNTVFEEYYGIEKIRGIN